jgi:hypothetical protein
MLGMTLKVLRESLASDSAHIVSVKVICFVKAYVSACGLVGSDTFW